MYCFDSIHRTLPFYYHVEWHFQWETLELLGRNKSGKSSPFLWSHCSNEIKNHQHWSSQFSSVYPLYRNSRFCNLVLFVNIRTWPYYQSYGSCFVEVWICLSVDQDPTAYKYRWAWSDTSSSVWLANINPHKSFAYVCRLSNKRVVNNCLVCTNYRRTTNNVFSNFLQ